MASIETGGPTPEEMGIKPEEKNEIAKEVEKNPELKRLQDALDLLESEIAGHPLVAQSTVDIFEEISLKRAQEKGVDVSQIPNFDARFLKLKQEAPKTELNDIIRRTEEFYKSGDIGSAKSWYAEADNKLRLFESKLSKQDVQIFMDRLKAMADLWK